MDSGVVSQSSKFIEPWAFLKGAEASRLLGFSLGDEGGPRSFGNLENDEIIFLNLGILSGMALSEVRSKVVVVGCFKS